MHFVDVHPLSSAMTRSGLCKIKSRCSWSMVQTYHLPFVSSVTLLESVFSTSSNCSLNTYPATTRRSANSADIRITITPVAMTSRSANKRRIDGLHYTKL